MFSYTVYVKQNNLLRIIIIGGYADLEATCELTRRLSSLHSSPLHEKWAFTPEATQVTENVTTDADR